MTDIMLDLETLSTEPNAYILSIGAVAFDPYREEIDVQDTFYANISLLSRFNLHISPETVDWWLLQALKNPNVINSLYTPQPVPLNLALSKLNNWIMYRSPRARFVWGNSPSFDCTIIKNACKAADITWPFMYHEERDVRTIVSLAYPDKTTIPHFTSDGQISHNALDDAIKQARLVQHCHQILGAHRM